MYIYLPYLLIIILLSGHAYAREIPFTQADRDRLIRVEAKVDTIEKRFEDINRRFEDMNKRFDDMNKRFEDMNKRFDDITNTLNRIVGAFVAIVVAVIGFALWDRRSMTRPFEDKVKKIEDNISTDRVKVNALIDSLKALSETDPKVAEVLKRFNIL